MQRNETRWFDWLFLLTNVIGLVLMALPLILGV